MDIDPGLTSLINRGHKNVFAGRRRAGYSGGTGIEHRGELPAGYAVQVLDCLFQQARLDAFAARRPYAIVDLAVLRLELRPADHALCRVEPGAPFVLARRGNAIDAREVAALVGIAV